MNRTRSKWQVFLGAKRPDDVPRYTIYFVSWFVLLVASGYLLLRVVEPAFVLLNDNIYWGLLFQIPLLFALSFLVRFQLFESLRTYPLWARVAGRIGILLPVFCLLPLIFLSLNGALDQSTSTRVVSCLGRRITRGTPPNYYVSVTPWQNSNRKVEIDVPEQIFREVAEGTPLMIKTGNGALGFEWIRQVEIAH